MPSQNEALPESSRIGTDVGVHSQNSEAPRASLLGLPLELRFQIYNLIFHTPTESIAKRPCEVIKFVNPDRGSEGCRCGQNLSVVSIQIYEETRGKFYNCAAFIIPSPTACSKFMEAIGHLYLEVGALDITYTNSVSESSLLQDIFEPLRRSTKLLHLTLNIKSRGGGSVDGCPLYIPIREPTRKAEQDAMIWDLSLRPLSHPLADLKSLRRLTILGYPRNSEIEEVLLRANNNLEASAAAPEHVFRTIVWTSDPAPTYIIESRKDPCPVPPAFPRGFGAFGGFRA